MRSLAEIIIIMPVVASSTSTGNSNFTPPRLAPIVERHEERDGGAGQREQLQHAREGIDDEAVAEQQSTVPKRRRHEHAGHGEEENREPQNQLAALALREHAEHQQRHGADRQDQLRQRGFEVERLEHVRGSLRHEREPRLLGGGEACVVVLDQRIDRGGRRIENRRGIEAEQDGEHARAASSPRPRAR